MLRMTDSKPTVLVPPIVIKGYKFFDSITGLNVIIKGIDYYPRPNSGNLDHNSIDFFTKEFRHIWQRDIIEFRELGINAVRLYSVDPNKDHSAFMCALNKAGIYALVELASEKCAILESKAPNCYPKQLKLRGEAIIREFTMYSNTLAFSAGNEVNHFVPNGEGPEWNAPCLKKFIKDMRQFVRSCSTMRKVPVGLITADIGRDENALYYNCQSSPDDDLERAEFYGINTYVVCDGNVTTYDEALGFKLLQSDFASYNYSIPVLLTEYGCLSQTFPTIDGFEGQRTFLEAQWLSLPVVRDIFAGGFAFEYSIEARNAQTPFPHKVFGHQNYGLGYFSPENCDDIKVGCQYKKTPAFNNLKVSYSKVCIDEAITLDSFQVDENRLGQTKCPEKFPPLHAYHWESDEVSSLNCPSKKLTDSCLLSTVPTIRFGFEIFGALMLAVFIVYVCSCIRQRQMTRFRLWRLDVNHNRKAYMSRNTDWSDGETQALTSSSLSSHA